MIYLHLSVTEPDLIGILDQDEGFAALTSEVSFKKKSLKHDTHIHVLSAFSIHDREVVF